MQTDGIVIKHFAFYNLLDNNFNVRSGFKTKTENQPSVNLIFLIGFGVQIK